jgi:uncharacterized protein (TIGR04141 family)
LPAKTFTLFLLKDRIQNEADFLSETAQSKLRVGSAFVSRNGELGEGSAAYLFQNPVTAPKWLTDVASAFQVTGLLHTQSASCVVTFRSAGRMFAVTFGSAWLFINPNAIVNDFGLRVALNASNDDRLRRLDISNLGEAMKGISQSASQRKFDTFGVDEALELVRKINGVARDGSFGSTVTGSNSLKVSKEMGLDEIPELAAEALTYFSSDAYKATSFRVIDNIMPVSDSDVIDRLDALLVQSILNNRDDFELGLPEISDADIASFRFTGGLRGRFYQDLQMQHYRQNLGANLQALTVSTLHQHCIIADYVDEQKPQRSLRLYDALLGSISYEGERYAINEGTWYRVEAQFRRSVDQVFRDRVQSFVVQPPVVTTHCSPDGLRQHYEREDSYNERYAQATGYVLMDQRFIDIPDVQRPQLEVCDLLDIEGKRLIHVKMSGRKSSVLSHFFKQGKNSARVLRSIDSAWGNVVERIRTDFDDEIADRLRDAIQDAQRPWKVEFHIVDHPTPTGEFNIPFFSRVTFRDEENAIKSMGYEVVVRFIRKPPVTVRRGIVHHPPNIRTDVRA